MGSLDGKVAFITGAARGQGRSHAIKLAEEGADIIGLDLAGPLPMLKYPTPTPADLEETSRLVAATGRRMLAVQGDVRSQDDLDKAVASGLEMFGRLDFVVGNAGIGGLHAKTWEFDDDAWYQMMEVNLTGVWRTVKAAVPAIINGGRGGSVVLTSSLAGLKGYSNIAPYVVAKHGVNGLMRTLANELAAHNIRCNSLCPGMVNTDMVMNQATFDLFRPDLEHPTQEDAAAAYRTMQALPCNWLEPRDISEAVAYFCSDASRYVTGTTMVLDGGQIGKG